MKIFNISCLLTTLMLLGGCQSFQFVESPIPVTSSFSALNQPSTNK